MKKIYSILLCAIAAVFCFSASAKTFTVKVTDPNQVYVIDPALSRPVTDFDEDNCYTFDTADFDASVTAINLSAMSGCEIVSVLDQDGKNPVDENIHFPNTSCAILIDRVDDNATVTVTTREKEKTFITVTGNPEQIYVTQNYSFLNDDNGVWSVETTYSGSFNIYPNDGYLITSVTDEHGNPVTLSGTYAYIYFSAGSTSAYTVEAVDLEASRTASFTVEVEGNPSDVVLTRAGGSYSTVSLTGNLTEVKFNPQSETAFQIRHANYSKSLYRVEKNGEQLQLPNSYSTTYDLQVSDGDQIKVFTDYPDVDVPVSFTFVNEGTEGVISGVRLDNDDITSTALEGFTAKLGQNLSISFNYNDFDITQVTVNGEPLSSYYSYSATLSSEQPLAFEITATPKPMKHVTIITNDPASIYLSTGYYGSGTVYTLTEEETEIEVPNSVYSLYLYANDGYYIEAVEYNGSPMTYFSSVSVADGDEIVILTKAVVRDSRVTLYAHQSSDWATIQFTTGYGSSLEKTYYNYDSTLPYGYSHYDFGEVDVPMMLRAYRSDYDYDKAHIYLNGMKVEGSYGGYSLDEVADGDVIKVYPDEPALYSVNYTIADNVDAVVRHDVFTEIENPSTHNVFEGTSVHIAPAANSPIDVKVNGEPLAADAKGEYSTTIAADSEISVTASSTVGIQEIEAVADDAPVYNLQGICVGSAADFSRLPSGIYIVNGVKVLN